MSDKIGELSKQYKQGDPYVLARLLTQLEMFGGQALKHDLLLEPPTSALRVGVTGPPGAGKSTLLARIVPQLRKRNLKVAVLAIDPTSPFSNGAILGDRIRFGDIATDPNVFVRSIGTRGSQGGLTSHAYLLLRAFDLWAFDVVLIETVGVGQSELEVMYAADFVAVALVPESGDAIQAMKAGILEIADLFIVNKSDRPGSESFAKELKDSVELDSEPVPILLTAASENLGINEVVEQFWNQKIRSRANTHRKDPKRLQAEARALLWLREQQILEKKVSGIKNANDLAKILS